VQSGEIRRNTDIEKVSQRKQSKSEKNSATFRQRGIRVLGVATAALLLSDQMIRVAGTESRSQVKELADRMQRSSNNPPNLYVPPAQEMEQTMKLVQELENSSISFRYGPKDAQGPSSEETSQAAMETHQGGQDKGMEPPMSYEKEMATLRAAIEELQINPNPNPELIGQARKLLAESRQQLPEAVSQSGEN
jgi:predicted  nucleic acid-binding Zn-ribbon protein